MSNDSHAAAEPAPGGGKAIWSRLLPVALVGAGLAAFFGLGLNQYFSLDALEENRDLLSAFVTDNRFIALAAFIGIYAAAVSISVPGASILTIFGGFLFGLWFGTAAVVIGATLGATIIFFITKTALGDVLRGKASGFVKRMEEGFREDAFSYLFSLRLIPAVPFWVLNIVPGVLGVKARDFILATFLGIIPATFVYVSIGNGIDAVFDAGERPTLSGVLLKPEILLPIFGLAALGLMPVIYKKVFAKKKATTLEGAH
ncbi:MAG: TVP38/TMEM64 family protein [Pseudomonadota bacterium]